MLDKNISAKKIFIVDDDQLILELVKIIFQRLGFQNIYCFDDGQTALSKMHSNLNGIDILILDLMMPGLDGIKFLRELISLQYEGNIILMSGSDKKILSSLERLGSKELKILGSIEKPITPDKIKSLLAKLNNPVDSFEAQPSTEKSKRLITVGELKEGIRASEFVPYFQPKVDLASNRVVGFEALARWIDKQGQIITPQQFIPLAETTGHILDIDLMIFEKTCTFMSHWIQQGFDYSASVNLSAESLCHQDASEKIIRITQNKGLNMSQLLFEITESVLVDEYDLAMENILHLHLHGGRLSIDDFGTGYSTMQYLQQIPFSELKIDQCFVTDSINDSSKRAIIKSCVELAERLDIKTVCEGVETEEDLAVVKSAGAHLGQGYFYSKPLAAEQFTHWIKNYN